MSVLRERGNAMAWIGATLCAWLLAWRHLSTEWSLEDRYQFGWGIPFLVVWIVCQRWVTSPEPPYGWLPRHPSHPSHLPSYCGGLPSALALAGFGWLLTGVGILAAWKDPIWRMAGALLAIGAVFVTAGLFYRLGGSGLLRRQAFSLGFSCFAIPWPVRIDLWITRHLLRVVTDFSVALLSVAGIPALQHGNLIELRTGVVGIEEACSGIDSFQASLVASVFLGEYFRLPIARRLALGIGGLVACMGGNCLRVLGLVLLVHLRGGASAEQWHNSIGGAATVFSFLCLGLLAYFLAGDEWKAQRTSRGQKDLIVPGRDGWAVLGSFLALPMGMWGAFHFSNPRAASQRATWKLDCHHLPQGWIATEVGPAQAAAASLHFTRWESCHLLGPEGWSAQVTHLVWNSRQNIPGTAFYHTPALCLSSSGWNTAAETETWKLDVRGRRIAALAYRLASPDGSLLVAIQSLSENGDSEGFMNDLSHPTASLNRFALLWRARARRVDEEILVYMPDLGSSGLQRKAFSGLLNLTLTANPAD